ncbi:Fanconi-associated nuclease OS=Stutzerimonas stutzeri OX=316 GN=CXK91_02370 PE=3 SV=1 [Stutzerimonas stutzeri]
MDTVIARMPAPLPPELYYLSNFRTALAWVSARYGDLLTPQELAFIRHFEAAQWQAQALLVRMIMRRGRHFRLSKLNYPEIGDCQDAALPLLESAWIDEQAPLTASEVAELLRKGRVAGPSATDGTTRLAE